MRALLSAALIALHDPEVDGVTCHIAYFERGLIDRLSKGN